jgi:hypothetical protein
MSARVWSSTPLWQIIDNGVMRPAKAKSYVLDQSHRPLPPSGWQSLHFGKLDKPVTMREVLADYAQFDSKKDYSLSYGPGTGTQLAKAQISQYNSVAWNEQIMNPGSGNLNIFSGRPMEIFNSEETAGLSGDVTSVIVTIKAMVAKIQSLKLNENDTTKLINDVYDKYLAPLITKFPSLKDPDTGVDIKDISYLLTLAPPASNANPNVVPVQLSKTTFTGSPPPVPAFPSGASVSTLGSSFMSSGAPPIPPYFPTPIDGPTASSLPLLPVNPRVIRQPNFSSPAPSTAAVTDQEYLAEQLAKRFAQAEPELTPARVIQQQHDIAKAIRDEPSGVEGKREAPQLTAKEIETRRLEALKDEAKKLSVYNSKDSSETRQKKVDRVKAGLSALKGKKKRS